MASVLNETGCSEESIRRNPAAVLGRDSPFFGPDASPWAAEIFMHVGGRVESYTQNLTGQITARLANNKAARNPVIVPIGSRRNSDDKGLSQSN